MGEGSKKRLIKSIDFGEVEGLEESSKTNFKDLFYNDDNFFQKLRDDRAFLIVGRKGSGKTLLAKYFQTMTQDEKHIVRLMATNDLIIGKLQALAYAEIADEERKVLWQYILLQELGKTMLDSTWRPYRNPLNLKYARLKQALDNLDKVGKAITSLEEVAVSANVNAKKPGVSSKIGAEMKASDQYEYREQYYNLFHQLRDAVTNFAKHTDKQFVLILDDGDELYLPGSDKEKFWIQTEALVTAMISVNEHLLNEGVQDTRIIETMRSDVYAGLQSRSHNLNKKTASALVELRWTSAESLRLDPWKIPVIKMVLHKIRVAYPDLSSNSDKELFNLFFAAGRSRTKGETKSKNRLAYTILDLGFGRPRDLILFLLAYQENYPEATQFTYSQVDKTIPSYNARFMAEVRNELAMANLDVDVDLILEAIHLLGFDKCTLDTVAKKVRENQPDITRVQVKEVLRALFNVGLIGIMKGQGDYHFSFLSRDNTQFMGESNTFVTHKALTRYFSLKKENN